MAHQNPDEVRALIEHSKELIAKMNELLAKVGAPVRFSEQPIEVEHSDRPGPQSPPA